MFVLRLSPGVTCQPLFAATSSGPDRTLVGGPGLRRAGPAASEALSGGTRLEAPYQIREGNPPTVSIHGASGGFPGIMQGGLVGTMGLGLLTMLTSDRDLLIPPFELSVRLLGPIVPGTTVQATDFQAEGRHISGISVASSEGVVLARTVWKRLETVSDDFSGAPDRTDGTDEADGSFHCLPTCFSAGEENPIGLKRTISFRHGPAGVTRLWADLDQGSGTDIRPQMVIGDELGWWMGAALMGREGVTHAYTYRVGRFPGAGEPLRVVAQRPSERVRRIVSVPVRVVNPLTGEGLAALEVKFIGRQDAASAGMGDRAGELVRFREERIGLLQKIKV